MTERDYVEETLSASYEGIFDFDGLYRHLKKWFKLHKYDLIEIDYKDNKEDGIRKIIIKWQAKRKVNDYVEDIIEASWAITNLEYVLVNKKKRANGSVSINFAAYLEKDYEETWYRSSLSKFIREVYDKFALGSQFDAMEKQLKKDIIMLVNETKSYLNMIKPRE